MGSQTDYGDYDLTSYDTSAVGWGATASSAWYEVIKRDFIAGEYVWTGFDYIGEPTRGMEQDKANRVMRRDGLHRRAPILESLILPDFRKTAITSIRVSGMTA